MNRWILSALALALLGGCLPSLPEPVRSSTAGPATVSAQPTPPAVAASAPEKAAVIKPASPWAGSLAYPEALAPDIFPKTPVNLAFDLAEILPAEELDPLALEDSEVLAEADLAVPEDEGVTVAAEVTFDFPVVENDKVRYYLDYFSGPGHKAFSRWLARSGRYLPLMQKIFAEEGLPLDLAYLAMIESGFNDRAYSWAHAVGPWQFIEGTGRIMGLQADWWRDERRDFEKSTRAAARHLRDLHDKFDGDWYLAVASYNAGPGKLVRAIEKYNSRDFWELTRGPYLQAETKNYLPKLLAAMLIAKEPAKYGFDDVVLMEPLAFDKVTVPTATDLELVAKLCAVDYEEIKQLNPELKRWCTPPGIRDYDLRIPLGSAEGFLAGYASVPPGERANYKHHRVKSGDTLLALAKKYGIRVEDIVALNQIKNPKSLRIGTDLILPMKKGYSRLPVDELKDDHVRTRRPTYTVRNGDSLWKVARKFEVSEKDLRVWNKLGWTNVIRPGQVLVVSGSAAKKGTVTKTAKRQEGSQRKISYRVRPGDTLWGISRQYDVAAAQIRDWNNLGRDHILRPGDVLTLMVREDGRSG